VSSSTERAVNNAGTEDTPGPLTEQSDRGMKTIKIPNADHPITIEPSAARIRVTVAGTVIADSRALRAPIDEPQTRP